MEWVLDLQELFTTGDTEVHSEKCIDPSLRSG